MVLFILICCFGFLFISWLAKDTQLFERLAISMPIGLGINTLLMFLFNCMGGKLSVNFMFILNIVLIGTLLLYFVFAKKLKIDSIKNYISFDSSNINFWVLVFGGMVAYLVYGITVKCLYWPPITSDTINGYDLLAKAIAHEGKLLNTILTDKVIVNECGPRLLYPPLLAYCNSLCYIQGMDMPKWINMFFYVSWVSMFFVYLQKLTNSTNAIFFTFFTVIIPEMYAHGSFEMTNLPTAFFAVGSVLCLLVWHQEKINSYLYLSILMSSLMMWTRTDSVFIFLGIQTVLLIYNFFKKTWKLNFLFSISLIPFLIWSFFSKYNIPKSLDSIFINHLFYDSEKLSKVIDRCWSIMTTSNLFGITVYFFLFILLIHIYLIYKKKDNWFILTIIMVGLAGYTLVFYQIDDKDGFLFWANGGWLDSGYKRGLFSFMPLLFVYISTSGYVRTFFDFVHEKLNFKS